MTTPARTAFDLGRRLPRERALVTLDDLGRSTGLAIDDVHKLAERYPRSRGLRQLRELLPLVDAGAESPPESLTRLLLIDDGLPRPETQLVVRDRWGAFIARLDLGWRHWQVAVEYDGIQHWTDPTQRTRDIDRIATLESHGWRVIRAGADLLHRRPHILLDRVRTALRARGAAVDK